jgi:uncharacterized membrane protein YqhA
MRKILGLTRYAVIVPALASMVGALLLMAQGSFAIIEVVFEAVVNNAYLKVTIVDVLTAVDAILLGTVLLVIGYGLYELFVDDLLEVPSDRHAANERRAVICLLHTKLGPCTRTECR